MINQENLIGIGIVLVFILLVILFSSKWIRMKHPPVFRKLDAAARIRREIGKAVEGGTRVHVALGSGSVNDPGLSSALAGLSTLDRIAQLASTSDLPPMASSGSGALLILSQDELRAAQTSTQTQKQELAQMPGATPFSYALGTLENLHESGSAASVILGDFGVEAALLCDTPSANENATIAGSNSLIGQSIFFALADEVLIGEEVFAVPAYLGAKSPHAASLRVEDISRVLLVLSLIGGALASIMGWI